MVSAAVWDPVAPSSLCAPVEQRPKYMRRKREPGTGRNFFQQTPALPLEHISQLIGRSAALLLPAILKGAFHLYSNSRSTPVFFFNTVSRRL